ncbi:hypothetical protein CLOM_g2239, partial [Closterium sp. NIES-68]
LAPALALPPLKLSSSSLLSVARRIGSRQIWLELEAMFERTDFDAVGPLFKEYFSITIEHSAGAVDYTSRLLDLASRLEARQTTLPPNLQIYRLLEGLSPQYEGG